MWNDLQSLLGEYIRPVLGIVGFTVSLIYLWKFEKRRERRILFIYVPLVVLLIYFNPWFAQKIQQPTGGEGYSRVLWLIPFTLVVAYAIVHAYGEISQKWRNVFVFVMLLLVLASGSYMYKEPEAEAAENIYYVPESVVHICDAITVPGREVMAVFPEELLQYVRQYSPVTCMPYGANVLENPDAEGRKLYEVMEGEYLRLDEVVPLTRKYSCHYIILPADKKIKGNPDYFGWIWFGETDGYAIYRDAKVELLMPYQ